MALGLAPHAGYIRGYWKQLEIRKRCDPTNLFRLNANIDPGA